MDVPTIFNLIFGSTGVITVIYAIRERKYIEKEKQAQLKLVHANTVSIDANTAAVAQSIYATMAKDLEKEFKELKEEVFMLRQTVKAYHEQCNNCPNFKYKNKNG